MSSYFRVLFQCRTWIDSDNFVIYVDDAICSENILRQLVDFAYTQNIQIRPGNDNTVLSKTGQTGRSFGQTLTVHLDLIRLTLMVL